MLKNMGLFKYQDNKLKRAAINAALFFCLVSTHASHFICAQTNGYGIWFLPSKADNIYGIAIGPLGSDVICSPTNTKRSHGVNIQLLGQGFFAPFYVFSENFAWHKSSITWIQHRYNDSLTFRRVVHNGVMVTGLGTFSEQINGISISPWMSWNHVVNGITCNALVNSSHTVNGLTVGVYNSTYRTNGLQIGLINQTNDLRGFQFGLWNTNNKRKLPLINWSFKPKNEID
jgi:hypothetical protein